MGYLLKLVNKQVYRENDLPYGLGWLGLGIANFTCFWTTVTISSQLESQLFCLRFCHFVYLWTL